MIVITQVKKDPNSKYLIINYNNNILKTKAKILVHKYSR